MNKLNNETQNNELVIQDSKVSTVEFGEVTVYNEMLDQTSVKVNLLERINSQLNQIEELNAKRHFVTQEIIQLVIA